MQPAFRMIFCIAKKLLRKAKSPFEDGWLCRVILVEQNSLTEQYFHIFVNRSNACDAEIGCQNIYHIGRQKCGKSWTQMDIFHTQRKQCE